MEENDGVSVLKHRRSHHSSPSPSSESSLSSGSNLELCSLKSSPATASYTSLKDLLPSSPASSILSPASATSSSSTTASSASEISIPIRNRLVKQAAWAYLQPAVSPCPSSSPRAICFPGDSLLPILAGFRKFVGDTVTRVYDWLVDALWLILCR